MYVCQAWHNLKCALINHLKFNSSTGPFDARLWAQKFVDPEKYATTHTWHTKAYRLNNEDILGVRAKILLAYMTRIPKLQRQGKEEARPREWYLGRYRLLDEQEEESEDDGAEPMEDPDTYREILLPEDEEASGVGAADSAAPAPPQPPGAAPAQPPGASGVGAAGSVALVPTTPPPDDMKPLCIGMGGNMPDEREGAVLEFAGWIDDEMAVHQEWVELVRTLLSGLAARHSPPLGDLGDLRIRVASLPLLLARQRH